MAGIKIVDIAKMANVSPATVSRVINNRPEGVGKKTRERILKIIAEEDYQPNLVARNLVTKKSYIIGLVIPDIENPFYSLLIKGAEEVAIQNGYNVILCNCDSNEEKEAKHLMYLRDSNAAGIIYNNYDKISKGVENIIKSINAPICYPDNINGLGNIRSTYLLHKKGMYDMASYLTGMGHKKFAYISGVKGQQTSELRLEGFLEGLSDNGIRQDKNLLKYNQHTKDGGYRAMRELLNERKDFTCVVCFNDDMAFGAMRLLHERGLKIPDDISITGFDNVTFAELTTPGLTTMKNPIYDMGKKSTELLIKHINGFNENESHEPIPYEPKLIIRETVKYLG
jgi:LacI family transcriptional regulator